MQSLLSGRHGNHIRGIQLASLGQLQLCYSLKVSLQTIYAQVSQSIQLHGLAFIQKVHVLTMTTKSLTEPDYNLASLGISLPGKQSKHTNAEA